MQKVNRLVLCRDDYENKYEFEDELKKAIMLLMGSGHIMTIKYDDGKEAGIVVIDYCYENRKYGDRYPYWLYPEEEESVVYKED